MSTVLLKWFLSAFISFAHPYYVSVLQIEHNAKDKNVEISVRVFVDDMEATLRKFGNTKVDLIHPADKKAMEKLMEKYLAEHFRLNVNGKAATMQYLGYEIQSESVWAYLEIPNIASLKEVGVTTDLLYDHTKEQVNIIQVKANDKKQSYKLDHPKTSASFVF